MASSSLVIKVRFGETLRRLNASINDKKLVLDMVMLKEKIRSLFSFGSDVDFTMTYVDEDGDTVTLADDDDLHDAVRQSLNPLRITVNLTSSTPLMAPQNHLPSRTVNPMVSVALKSVPEPLLEALAKLPLDFADKALSSAPALAELVEKMKGLYSSQILPSTVHVTTDGPTNGNSASSTVKDSKAQLNVNCEAEGLNTNKTARQVQKATGSVKFNVFQPPKGADHNIPYFGYESFQTPNKNKNITDDAEKKKDSIPEKKHGTRKNTNDSGRASGWAQGMLNAANQCPFSGMPLMNDSDSEGNHWRFSSPHWKRYSHDNNGMGTIFHRGVRCDGCGVHPITGPRFKSKVKVDYDLCNLCFARMGNGADYIKIDRPTTGFGQQFTPAHVEHVPSMMLWPKLDSRFILDVNVLDGTIMAPLTAFTKIWRMRNSGSAPWPYGSRLQWIGGDRLSNSLSVAVQIPVDGLQVNTELDIAADFTAPELPGRYVSYWRMASPSGQKFGQRVWVLIQVDGETSTNPNPPPVTRDQEAVNHIHLSDKIISGNNLTTETPTDNLSAPPETVLGSALPPEPSVTSGFFPKVGVDTEPISYPTVDFSVMPGGGAVSLPPPVVVQAMGSGGEKVSDDEEMEWDTMLDELREMGFEDDEVNRKLLKKNNGSIKGAVMDLIYNEKA